MRARVTSNESKKPLDLCLEVFVWRQRFAFFAFFFLAFAFLGAFFADFLADALAFLPTFFFGPTFLYLRLRRFRRCFRRGAYRIGRLFDDSFHVVHIEPPSVDNARTIERFAKLCQRAALNPDSEPPAPRAASP